MYARHCFRQLTRALGETIRQFATRLRLAVKEWNCGEDTDNQIRDEILGKYTNTYIKRKLLEEGHGLTLARALKIATSFPGSFLYLEKVPWLWLVMCLYMPTTDAQRVGPQQTSTFNFNFPAPPFDHISGIC